MSEILDLFGYTLQTSQVIGIGKLETEEALSSTPENVIHSFSVDLFLRNQTVRLEIGEFANYPRNLVSLSPTDVLKKELYDAAIDSFQAVRQKVENVIKLRPAHEL